MLHGVLPLSGALVTIGLSDLLRYICSASHEKGFRLLPWLHLGLTARSMALYTYMHYM